MPDNATMRIQAGCASTEKSLRELSLLYYLRDYQQALRDFQEYGKSETSWEDGRIHVRVLSINEIERIEKELTSLHDIIRTLDMYYVGTEEAKGDQSRWVAEEECSKGS